MSGEYDAAISEKIFGTVARYTVVPQYTKHIALAFLVQEEMKRRGWSFQLSIGETVMVKFKKYLSEINQAVEFQEVGKEVPFVICRAAIGARQLELIFLKAHQP